MYERNSKKMTFSQKTRREKGGIFGGHHSEMSLLDGFLQMWNLYFTLLLLSSNPTMHGWHLTFSFVVTFSLQSFFP